MPYISLTATDENYHDYYESYGVVKKQDYDCSRLFIRYEHTPTSTLSIEPVYIYEGYSTYSSNRLSLRDTDTYKKLSLTRAHVYFNRYDTEHECPLLFVLFFNGDRSFYKYCKRSDFENEIKQNEVKLISELDWYNNELGILKDLIDENDKIDELLMFDIEKNTFKGDYQYNDGKIRVVEDSSGEPELTNKALKRYKHEPVDKWVGKKGCVTYRNQLLLDKEGKEIDGIQGEEYDSVNVYFWDNPILKQFDAHEEIPILLELNKTASPGNPECYVAKKDEQGEGTYYWEKVDISNAEQYGVTPPPGDVHTEFTDHEKRLLTEILNSTKYALVNSIFVLIEKRGTYKRDDVETAVKSAIHPIILDTELSIFQPEKIIVKQKENNFHKLKKTNYKLYEHTVDINSTALSLKPDVRFELKLLIPTSHGNCKYSELKLYNNKVTIKEKNREHLTLNRGRTSSIKLDVYFCGEDPRPLLLCCNGMTYRPLSLPKLESDKYNYSANSDCTKWIRVPEITSSGCEGESALIDLLNEVYGIENGFKPSTIVGGVIGLLVLTGLLAGLAFCKNAHLLMAKLKRVYQRLK